MSETNVTYRIANVNDSAVILKFIKCLAEYENMSNEVVNTEEKIKKVIFGEKRANVLLACENGIPVGFALYFFNYSTFLGQAGLYLEDLFVLKEHRKKGIGKGLFKELAKIAEQNDCGRMEWCCLDWNQPSIDFYLLMNAKQMSDWTTYRLCGETLDALIDE